MKLGLLSLLLGAIFGMVELGACEANLSNSYQVVIDPSFSSENVALIDSALESWARKAPVVFYSGVGQLDCSAADSICIHASTQAEVVSVASSHNTDAIGYTLRSTWTGRSDIWLALDVDLDVYRTTLHEVGHALGLSHTGPGTIMCASLGCESADVTPADVAQYESLR